MELNQDHPEQTMEASEETIQKENIEENDVVIEATEDIIKAEEVVIETKDDIIETQEIANGMEYHEKVIESTEVTQENESVVTAEKELIAENQEPNMIVEQDAQILNEDPVAAETLSEEIETRIQIDSPMKPSERRQSLRLSAIHKAAPSTPNVASKLAQSHSANDNGTPSLFSSLLIDNLL